MDIRIFKFIGSFFIAQHMFYTYGIDAQTVISAFVVSFVFMFLVDMVRSFLIREDR
jgi:hypothetical protein